MYITRAFQLLVVFLVFWFFLYFMGAVQPPDWSETGKRTRTGVAAVEQARDGFTEGFDQRAAP